MYSFFIPAPVLLLLLSCSSPPAPAPLRLLLSSAACQCRQKSKTSSSSAIQGDLALPLPPPPSPLYPQPALHVLFSISFSHCLWQRISGIAGLLSLIDDHSNSDCLCRCRCPLPCPALPSLPCYHFRDRICLLAKNNVAGCLRSPAIRN